MSPNITQIIFSSILLPTFYLIFVENICRLQLNPDAPYLTHKYTTSLSNNNNGKLLNRQSRYGVKSKQKCNTTQRTTFFNFLNVSFSSDCRRN